MAKARSYKRFIGRVAAGTGSSRSEAKAFVREVRSTVRGGNQTKARNQLSRALGSSKGASAAGVVGRVHTRQMAPVREAASKAAAAYGVYPRLRTPTSDFNSTATGDKPSTQPPQPATSVRAPSQRKINARKG